MSKDIKPGDLVMVIKPPPCCGSKRYIGFIFTAGKIKGGPRRCACDVLIDSLDVQVDGMDAWVEISRLIKIDPPEEGDSLPTRVDKTVDDEAAA